MTDGNCSGYETVTETGSRSCAERSGAEDTDCESTVSGKKKKRRFLGECYSNPLYLNYYLTWKIQTLQKLKDSNFSCLF